MEIFDITFHSISIYKSIVICANESECDQVKILLTNQNHTIGDDIHTDFEKNRIFIELFTHDYLWILLNHTNKDVYDQVDTFFISSELRNIISVDNLLGRFYNLKFIGYF